MNITLKSEEIEVLKDKLAVVANYHRYNSYNPEKRMKIDLASLSGDQLKQVETVLEKRSEINKCPLGVIKQWKKIMANPNDRRAQTLEQLATILKAYLSKVPKYMLFKQSEDEDMLGYVVTKVGYQPPERHSGWTSPAYVYIQLVSHVQGKNKSFNLRIHKADMAKNCAEILNSAGYFMATDDMLAAYLKEVERYTSMRGKVGHQVLGTGRCMVVGEEKRWWGGTSRTESNASLDVDGRRTRLVVDFEEEVDDEDRHSSSRRGDKADIPMIDGGFWKTKAISKGDGDDDDADEGEGDNQLEVPLHPLILLFHLEKHCQVWAHINRLEDYVYDTKLGEKLVLPPYQLELINILVQRDRAEITDIISGKAGGSIVLCSGKPGTGKTLTAEVFAEVMQRPLYVVQSAQLGTEVEHLETELCRVLARASRWGAILLIDETDVFIHERGDNMVQNAVVGVFLRVLEYYQGVLFMTTNRDTIVDDAVISRCTAQVKFPIPDEEAQIKIWKILASLSKVEISDAEIKKFAKAHVGLSGRDVKGVLKLANMISVQRKEKMSAKLLEYVMQFKPTTLAPEAK